jgi:hypothetical protein
VASETDAYRTLGLPPGASADDIRRAYRRLAKANHPDSAGEKALPRFLAIQAAYESLTGIAGTRWTGARAAGSRSAPRDQWRADPERARATRDGRSAGGDPAAGRRRRPAGEEARRQAGEEARRRAGDEPRRPAGGRRRPSNKATPGSTTYDAADEEPFEPEWSGGTWYGASSGTYWTINPKEYADPRKHGPEYQRRARRHVDGSGTWEPDEPATELPHAEPWPTAGPTSAGGASGPADDTPAAAAGLEGIGAVVPRSGFPARLGLALVGWPPIGIAISTIVGEVTGCGRFAASCVDVFGTGTWVAQLAVFLVLLALPSVAALSAVGTLAALAAAIPTAVVLSASGGAREPAASAAVLGAVLAVAYLAGVAFALVRRWRMPRVP